MLKDSFKKALEKIRKNRKVNAILFTKKEIDDNNYYLYPEKFLVGKYIEEEKYFHDFYSDEIHNVQDIESKSCIISTDNVLKMLGYKNKRINSPLPLLIELKKNILVVELEHKRILICDEDSFYERYGFEPEDKFEAQLERIFDEEEDEEKENDCEENNLLSLKIDETIKEIEKTVVSQNDAVKKVVTAVYKNYLFDDPEMKSNILIYGPTGVGKTEIVRQLAKILKLPVLVEDMNRYTPSGYVGSQLDDVLKKLYLNANENLELAQRSILILDEIDKKASKQNDKDFLKEDVLNSLLKIIEGGIYDIEVPGNFPGAKKTINFDTSNLTVIAMGAFSELQERTEERKTVGFNTPAIKQADIRKQNIDISDFVKYGFKPEFIGRFNTIVSLNYLGKDELRNILLNSNKSPMKKYESVLEKIGVSLEVKEEIYEKIVDRALSKNTGARGLKLVTDELFNDVLFEIFNCDNKENLVIKMDNSDSKKLILHNQNN